MRATQQAKVAELTADHGRLLTPAEASALTGLTVTALRCRSARGTLPSVQMGALSPRRYREADIHALLGWEPLNPGDPIPPERTGGMAGFVAGECGHRVAGSEWAAGFRNCERCGESR